MPDLPRYTVGKVIRTYKGRLSTERKPGSSQKTGFQNANLAVCIRQSYRRNPNLFERTVANQFGTSKAMKVSDRDQEEERRAKSRTRKLYDFFTKFDCCVMNDETYCVADVIQIPGQEFYVASQGGKIAEQLRPETLATTPRHF
ncbi:hypothetical protein ILUMI_22759 [Ignelater luminosus]|uniref:Uncharacterized protein n=1 Tax=Ignelater luminosus TaxID=2038154 RepID=A0A8K0FX93_IGNLU|nr:hypothetical protein ILUMI_22759 [Ignelater luminosus]